VRTTTTALSSPAAARLRPRHVLGQEVRTIDRQGADFAAANEAFASGAAGAATVARSPLLHDYGGPVLENVEVYAVYWGHGVSEKIQATLPRFFGHIVGPGSAFYSMLSEYDTVAPSPVQNIGYGRFAGSVTDHGPPAGSLVTDTQIQAELSRLIDEGTLPSDDDGNRLYMVYFPPGITIDRGGNTLSCDAYCAYHEAYLRNGGLHYYGVMPDVTTGACAQHCGSHADPLDNLLSISSHELVEATTDPAAGITDQAGFGPPLAWYDRPYGEIADICESFPDGEASGFPVQRMWSNEDRGCRDHRPTSNITIDASPQFAATGGGQTGTFTVTAAGTLTTPATLSVAGLPFGVSAAFNPPTILPNQSSVMTITAGPEALTTFTLIQIEANDANGEVHYSTGYLNSQGAPPTLASISPATAPPQGGPWITITGTGISVYTTVMIGNASTGPWKVSADGTQGSFQAPPNVPGVYDVVLQNLDGSSSAVLPAAFRVTSAASPPSITKVDPPGGEVAGNDVVTLEGANIAATFDPNANTYSSPQVTVAGKPVPVFYADANNVQFITPPSPAGAVDIVVTNPDGSSVTVPHGFAYGVPVATGLSASHGGHHGGEYVSLFGVNFEDGATVTFGGETAKILTRSPSFIGLRTPHHAAGTVDVVVTNPDGKSATLGAGFTYQH
jgi:hypothetical protein